MVDIEKNLICQHPKGKTILKGRQRRYCSEEHKRYVQNQRALHGDKTLGVPKPQKKKVVKACESGKEKLIHYGHTSYGHNFLITL